jgi:flagellar export protein FliJ
MRPFKFSLQPVRLLRQRRENKAMEVYATAVTQRCLAENELREADLAIETARVQWQKRARSGISASDMAHLATYWQTLQARRANRVAGLEQAQRNAAASLQTMVEARHERQVIEKLLAKQKLDYNRDLVREDQKIMDDLAQHSFEPEGSPISEEIYV